MDDHATAGTLIGLEAADGSVQADGGSDYRGVVVAAQQVVADVGVFAREVEGNDMPLALGVHQQRGDVLPGVE